MIRTIRLFAKSHGRVTRQRLMCLIRVSARRQMSRFSLTKRELLIKCWQEQFSENNAGSNQRLLPVLDGVGRRVARVGQSGRTPQREFFPEAWRPEHGRKNKDSLERFESQPNGPEIKRGSQDAPGRRSGGASRKVQKVAEESSRGDRWNGSWSRNHDSIPS